MKLLSLYLTKALMYNFVTLKKMQICQYFLITAVLCTALLSYVLVPMVELLSSAVPHNLRCDHRHPRRGSCVFRSLPSVNRSQPGCLRSLPTLRMEALRPTSDAALSPTSLRRARSPAPCRVRSPTTRVRRPTARVRTPGHGGRRHP